jgi:hypothetical protein
MIPSAPPSTPNTIAVFISCGYLIRRTRSAARQVFPSRPPWRSSHSVTIDAIRMASGNPSAATRSSKVRQRLGCITRSRHLDPRAVTDAETVIPSSRGEERIPIATALLALFASALLRTFWFALVLIMPRTTTGVVIFYLVLASAGIVLLHWCLAWFGWTISLRAAMAARALPGLAAAAVAGVIGFHASLPAVAALLGVEFLLGAFIVRIAATRPEGWAEFASDGEHGERMGPRLDEPDCYTTVASYVRAARAARTG